MVEMVFHLNFFLKEMLKSIPLCHFAYFPESSKTTWRYLLIKQHIVLRTHPHVLSDPVYVRADVLPVDHGRAGSRGKQTSQYRPIQTKYIFYVFTVVFTIYSKMFYLVLEMLATVYSKNAFVWSVCLKYRLPSFSSCKISFALSKSERESKFFALIFVATLRFHLEVMSLSL